jgi:hypothetical protein
MKLDSITIADVSDMPIMPPGMMEPLTCEDGRPMVISLAGQDSRQYKEAKRAFHERLARRREPRPTVKELEDHNLALAVACTMGWVIEVEAGDLPFSSEKARELYTDKNTAWVLDQALAWINDREKYAGKSSRTSGSGPGSMPG